MSDAKETRKRCRAYFVRTSSLSLSLSSRSRLPVCLSAPFSLSLSLSLSLFISSAWGNFEDTLSEIFPQKRQKIRAQTGHTQTHTQERERERAKNERRRFHARATRERGREREKRALSHGFMRTNHKCFSLLSNFIFGKKSHNNNRAFLILVTVLTCVLVALVSRAKETKRALVLASRYRYGREKASGGSSGSVSARGGLVAEKIELVPEEELRAWSTGRLRKTLDVLEKERRDIQKQIGEGAVAEK